MKRIRSLPIQVRITLGSVVVAAVVLAAVAVLLAFQIRSTTADSEATLARSDIAPYISDLQNNPDESPDQPATGVLVAIRAQSGKFLLNSLPTELQRNLNDRDLHDPTFDRVIAPERNAEAPTRRVTSQGTTYIVVERHLSTTAGDYTLWAARSATSGDLTIRALDRSLVIGLIVALLAFAAASWLLSSLSLRPVRKLARSAEQLSRDDQGQPLPVSPAGDELTALATTLNTFISRLRASADHERQMISDASHELRTPIAALVARLELAHRSFGDATALEHELLAAEKSAARLAELTTALLELSRLDETAQAGTPVVSTSAEDLSVELLDAVDRARISPTSAAVSINYDVDQADRPELIYRITPTGFARIADNLISNAVAFTPPDSVVSVTLSHDTGGQLLLTVEDAGPGFPAEFLPVAFDRFTRADEARRRVRGGNGLGLALVQGIATRAGGHAHVGNRPDGGASATVVLPSV